MKKICCVGLVINLIVCLMGCGNMLPLKADATEDEVIQCPNVYKCSFVSLAEKYDEEEEEWYFDSSIFRHTMKYDLNDFYRHNDNYEAIYRTYKNVQGNSANYVTCSVSQSLDGLREQAALLEHYHFIVLDLVEADRLPEGGEKYQTIVFDVETGDYWTGDSSDALSVYGKCIDDEYSADSDLIEYVEGKWPVPEYRTFYEYLCSMDWLQDAESEDL